MLWEAMQLSFRRQEPKKDVPGTRKDNAMRHQLVTFALRTRSLLAKTAKVRFLH